MKEGRCAELTPDLPASAPLRRGVLIDEAEHGYEEVGGDLKALRAQLVEGVAFGVVEGLGVGGRAVFVVDDVENGDAALPEGEVVVRDGLAAAEEGVAVAGFAAGLASSARSQGVELPSLSMLSCFQPIMSASRRALMWGRVPSPDHLAARWRLP